MIDVSSPSYRKIAFGLALGSFIVFCHLYLFQPLLPIIAADYHVSITRANWVLAAATLTLALSSVPWAIASEIIGRRTVMLVSLYLLPIIGLTMLFSENFVVLVIARGAMGVALAGYVSVAVAYMSEEFSPKAFALAVGAYVGANSLGGIMGRVFGGVVSDHYDWHAAVLGMMIFGLISAVTVTLLVPAQKNFTPQRGLLKKHILQVPKHLKDPVLWFAMLIGGLNFALFVNLYTVMGLRLVAPPYLMPVGYASLIFICYLAGTVTSKLSGHWVRYYSPLSGIVFGASVSMFGMFVGLIPSVVTMIIALLLISAGAFLTHSLAYGWVNMNAKTGKATATALYLVHYYVGGSLGGFYLITCWKHGGWKFVVIGGSLLFAILFALCWRLSKITNADH